jgi:hypothetical protein
MGQCSKEKANRNNPLGATKTELNTELERRAESLPNIGFLHFSFAGFSSLWWL